MLALLLASIVPLAAAAIVGDDEIRRILAERIDTRKQAVGIVAGVIDPAGRRVVSHGKLAAGDTRTPDGDTVFEIGSVRSRRDSSSRSRAWTTISSSRRPTSRASRFFEEKETTFFLKVVDAQIAFELDPAGRVTGLILHQAGRSISGKRIE
jgi:hypothetical protein